MQLQDVVDRYQRPAAPSLGDFGDVLSGEIASGAPPAPSTGFVVKGGPWEQRAPDTASTHEFPTMPGAPRAAAPAAAAPTTAWGPRR